MGGGWVTAAEATANAIDYPPPENESVNEETVQPATDSSGAGESVTPSTEGTPSS